MTQIDGSQGEGGGQILRTALALSLYTQQPFRITKIRAGRAKPGLLRQHLTAVKAAETVGNATVSGAEMGSQELCFKPDVVQPGNYQFAVGTAGSATLVFQTVLPALMNAGAFSTLICQGGTMNPFAPPFDFLDSCFALHLRRMGLGLKFKFHIPGFYPAGGGEFHAQIEPVPKLTPLSIMEKGALQHRLAKIYLSNLPEFIADREIAALKSLLSWSDDAYKVISSSEAPGSGNAILLEERHEHVSEMVVAFGEKGVTSEKVARAAVDSLRRHQASFAVVGEHLADQLLIPFALAGSGEFITSRPSTHSLTNAQTISHFLDKKIHFRTDTDKTWRCVVE